MQAQDKIVKKKKAWIIKAPPEGDCFFHVVAFFVGGGISDVKQAKQIRYGIAKYLAKHLFKPPYDDLKTLTDFVLGAKGKADLLVIKDNDTEEAATLRNLRPHDDMNVARNGGDCARDALPAWVVWFQFDYAKIKSKEVAEDVCQDLLALDFLKYTIWGDLGLAAHVVQMLTNRPVVAYFNENEQQGFEKPINIYSTANHFDAIVFYDDNEIDEWQKTVLAKSPGRFSKDSIVPIEKCAKTGEELSLISQVKVNSSRLKDFYSQERARNQKYASPGLLILQTPQVCYEFCEYTLLQRREIMRCKSKLVLSEEINFNKFPNPPIYVISSNRSIWLSKNFWQTFNGQVANKTGRAVIFAVGYDEYENYLKVLQATKMGANEGVYVLGCEGGFGIGWNRHCALKHARGLGLPRVWMLDDDIVEVRQNKHPAKNLDDSLMDTTWIVSLWPGGIMQRGLGFNLQKMSEDGAGDLNFCPFFAFSKEDLTLQLVKEQYYEHFCYIEPNCVVEKATAELDYPKGLETRMKPMSAVAELQMWVDAESKKPVNLLKENLNPYLIMRMQEQTMYDCIKGCPGVLKALVEEGWFSDKVSD